MSKDLLDGSGFEQLLRGLLSLRRVGDRSDQGLHEQEEGALRGYPEGDGTGAMKMMAQCLQALLDVAEDHIIDARDAPDLSQEARRVIGGGGGATKYGFPLGGQMEEGPNNSPRRVPDVAIAGTDQTIDEEVHEDVK